MGHLLWPRHRLGKFSQVRYYRYYSLSDSRRNSTFQITRQSDKSFKLNSIRLIHAFYSDFIPSPDSLRVYH